MALIKNSKISGDKTCNFKYTFQLKPSNLSKENRKLQKVDNEILESLKVSHYISPNNLNNLVSCLGNLSLSRWYHSCQSLSYMVDNMSVKAHVYFKEDKSFDLYVDYLFQDFLDYLKTYKGMKRIHTSKILEVCRWFVYNLSRCLSKGKLAITYYRHPTSYIKTREDTGLSFPYTVMWNLVEFLTEAGYVHSFSGYNFDAGTEGDPVPSLLVLTGDLRKYYSGREKLVDYDLGIEELVQVREKIEIGGKVENVTLNIQPEWECVIESDIDFLFKLNKLYSGSCVTVNGHIVPDIWFKRIYTKNISLCGRFFDSGQYQRFDKLSRVTTIIDGEATERWDFDSLHPSLLYARKGIQLDHDPYPKINIKHSKVLVNKFKKYYGYDKYDPERNLCKLVMLCMINADSKEAAVSAVVQKLYLDRAKIGCRKRESTIKFCGLPMNPDIRKIMDFIEENNEGIKEFFYTGVGLELMNTDSRIIEYVLRQCINDNIVALPLHDEMICRKSDSLKIKRFMEDGYKVVVGSSLNCNVSND